MEDRAPQGGGLPGCRWLSPPCAFTGDGELSGACFERSLVPFKRTDRLPKGPLLPATPWGPDLPYKAWGTQRKETCDSERDPSLKGPTTRRWARADGGLRLRWRGRRRPRVCSPWLAGDRYGTSVTREGNRQTRRDTSGPSRALGLVGSLLAGGWDPGLPRTPVTRVKCAYGDICICKKKKNSVR